MGEDKIRIIIADDSAIIRGILDKLFKSDGGFEVVDSVSNGRKAYDSAKMHDVDAIISDIDMPELNGIESTKLITKELGVPVIILSEDVKLKSQAIDAGALFFEPKPALSALRIENLKNFTEKVKAEVKKLGRRHSHPITDIEQKGRGPGI